MHVSKKYTLTNLEGMTYNQIYLSSKDFKKLIIISE